MPESHDPAPPEDHAETGGPQPETFAVTFTGPPPRNTMRLEGEGEMWFEGGEVTVEGEQSYAEKSTRPVRFMFTLREIARIGLHDGAVVLEIRPAAEPAKSYFLSFYVSCEEDAHRLLEILRGAEPGRPAAADTAAIERFYARLRRAPVLVTHALLAANVAIFALMALTGAGLVNPDLEAVIRWGARFNPLIDDGQWWRIATPMFVHIGLVHLLFNMWALKTLGDFVERLYGPVRFGMVYAGAGLAGGVLSYVMRPEIVSAGASGAIFGIMGALVAFIYRRHQAVPRQVLAGIRASAFSFIGYNLFFGFMIRFIDNWAHLGGLAGGLVLGWLLAPAETGTPAEDPRPETIAAAGIQPPDSRLRTYASILAVVLVGLVALGREVTPPEQIRNAELALTAARACDNMLKEKFGAGAPTCKTLRLGAAAGARRWRARAFLSDGRTMDLTVVDRGEQVEVIP